MKGVSDTDARLETIYRRPVSDLLKSAGGTAAWPIVINDLAVAIVYPRRAATGGNAAGFAKICRKQHENHVDFDGRDGNESASIAQ